MKSILDRLPLLLTVFLLQTTLLRAQEMPRLQTTEIQSTILDQKRPVLIYTPSMYDERTLVSFDVIYVFDAQNRELFDLAHAAIGFSDFNRRCIVVGVVSPAYEEQEYYRNHDMLPAPINVKPEEYMVKNANGENFWRYVTDELIPYIEKNYRTSPRRIAIGHSLSASFVLDKMIHYPNVFDAALCISPNLAYDKFRLANDFTKLNFEETVDPKLIYISQADELTTMNASWNEGYQKVKTFLAKTENKGKYAIPIQEFPNNDHWNTYLAALPAGLRKLSAFLTENPLLPKGDKREVTFRVTVPNKADDVFITGNQETLGMWAPEKVKLNRVSEYVRELRVFVYYPLEFKITRGTWESEAITDQSNYQGENIFISDTSKYIIPIKVNEWFDK